MIGFIMCVHPCPILGPPLISAGWCACALVLTEVGVFYLLWQLKDGEDTVAEEPQCVPARRGALVEEDLLWCYWYGLWRPYSFVIVASGCWGVWFEYLSLTRATIDILAVTILGLIIMFTLFVHELQFYLTTYTVHQVWFVTACVFMVDYYFLCSKL